ncbi:MAG: bifunctional diaminohydroxyphosphoribosylaminopyrimidine deaminase/5-amino-6-(5-phosphoribosylamino)uracil reductase RibD [Cytophagaceae bacterium]
MESKKVFADILKNPVFLAPNIVNSMERDTLYMQRCLELAELGRGNVSPNPMVGCVIVKENRIIGEGWHKSYGGPHAEVNAINSVEDKSLLEAADLYVSLEPCAHHGKTPPCADLIVQYPFKRVIICNTDPNPLVKGKGIAKIRENGIEVRTGILEKEGLELNKRFFYFLKNKRPYIILKWAMTADGFIARENYDSKWISNEFSRMLVHKWRGEEDAIMVGTNTALYDNPILNVRDWSGRDPLRVVIDKKLRLPASANLLNGGPTLIYNLEKDVIQGNNTYIKLPDEDFLKHIMEDLGARNIQSLIVEGGSKLLGTLIACGFWNEARIVYSPITFDTGIKAPAIAGKVQMEHQIGQDKLQVLIND